MKVANAPSRYKKRTALGKKVASQGASDSSVEIHRLAMVRALSATGMHRHLELRLVEKRSKSP